MTEILTYRRSETGLWRYEFVRNGQRFGSVSSASSPRDPARIEGPGFSWSSLFDLESTIVPGLCRKVLDSRTGEEVFRMIWWDWELYEVRSGERSLQVEIRNGSYYFAEPGMPPAAMAEGMGGESPYFRTLFFDPVSEGYMLMALAFPALRFC